MDGRGHLLVSEDDLILAFFPFLVKLLIPFILILLIVIVIVDPVL